MQGTQRETGWRSRLLLLGVGVGLVLTFAGFEGPADGDFYFKINKSIDVFGRVYKEIATNYVDEIDPEKFMQAGIDGMLGTLDPYTVYIDREDGDEVDLVTNGRYGGIGVTIGLREGALQVISVMDGYPAQRQGILQGDRILEIDGMKVTSKRPEDVRNLTRGEPGTEVRVNVQRDGESAPLQFVLVREEIQIKNVTYATLRDDGIAYIKLERFSRKAGEEVRQSIKELKVKGDIKGVILDVRGNPGGLLDAAVDVVSKFVPRGSLVVTTKGRRTEADKKYLSIEEPMLPETPLAILTDRNSASASEIVSGALQDMDRAVIIGTRTFGKGLVQTILPLSYGAQLKVTTARYYIPSGRSIQEIDYIHRDKNGVFTTVPDSLKREFRTAHGRKVFEYGGISPDSTVTETEVTPVVRELYRKSLFFKFVNKYVGEHKQEGFAGVTDEMLREFRDFVASQKFEYQEEGEVKLKELQQIAEKSNYSTEVLEHIGRAKTLLEREKERAFDRFKDQIRRELAIEMSGRTRGEQGRIESSLVGDRQFEAAVGVLKDPKVYSKKIKT
jgi:carboxyl-terminal processing protease